MNRNEVIDECVNKIKGLIRPHCDDHTPFRGACVSCGSYYTWDELPDLETVIETLENLKETNEG